MVTSLTINTGNYLAQQREGAYYEVYVFNNELQNELKIRVFGSQTNYKGNELKGFNTHRGLL